MVSTGYQMATPLSPPNAAEHDAQEDDQSARLGADGEERGDRIRRAFVDVGRPDMERDHGNLEADADEHEDQAESGRDRHAAEVKLVDEHVEAGRAHDAEDVGHAHDEEGGGEPAQDEIFHPGLQRGQAVAAVGDEDVKGNRHQLQRDEEEHEVVGRGEEHESHGGEKRQDGEFAAVLHRLLHLVAHPDDQRGHGEEEEVEELG